MLTACSIDFYVFCSGIMAASCLGGEYDLWGPCCSLNVICVNRICMCNTNTKRGIKISQSRAGWSDVHDVYSLHNHFKLSNQWITETATQALNRSKLIYSVHGLKEWTAWSSLPSGSWSLLSVGGVGVRYDCLCHYIVSISLHSTLTFNVPHLFAWVLPGLLWKGGLSAEFHHRQSW